MSRGPSDPTPHGPAGPGPEATGSWAVSLAEIDAMGRKAARGAGYEWGMAEEAGRAARWLAAYGQPGPETLAALLAETDGAAAAHAPGPDWTSRAAALCPIALGTALSDIAHEIGPAETGPVLHPLMTVPFLCRTALDLGIATALEGPGFRLLATPDGPVCETWDDLYTPRADRLRIARAEPSGRPIRPRPDARTVPLDVWRALDRFAQRTYVPATEASRRSGAGGGDGD